MTIIDTVRLDRLQKKMASEDLAALVCRLPENVVYLTDYWPHHGFSVAVLPREGKPMLFVPEVELDYSNPEWTDTMPFGWGLLKDGDLYENYQRLLSLASQKLGLKGKRDRRGAEFRSGRAFLPHSRASRARQTLGGSFGVGLRGLDTGGYHRVYPGRACMQE